MQQPDCRRKRRTAGRLGQARDALWPADPNLFVEDQPGKLAYSVQLTSSTSQHHASARDLVEPASLQTIPHQLESLLNPRRNNPDEQRFRHMIDMTVILFSNLWDSDHLTLVGT